MEYFDALRAASANSDAENRQDESVPSPEPLPKSHKASDIVQYIKRASRDLCFSGESDEPVEVYQLSGPELQSLERDDEVLSLPDGKTFADVITDKGFTRTNGFVSERRPVDRFFEKLEKQQPTPAQKKLAAALGELFKTKGCLPGSSTGYYRVGEPPNIYIYVVMLIDGQIVGIRTLSIET